MSSISNATRKALATVEVARNNPQSSKPLAPVSVRPFSAPALLPVLSRELDRALAGPLVLPGAGEGDAAMILRRVLEWQPGAAEAAECLRAGMEGPATRETVEWWLATLAMMVVNAPADPKTLELHFAVFWRLCSELPAAVWSEASIYAYCSAEKYWPKPAELLQFLQAQAKLLECRLAGLEKIARAPRPEPCPARKSTMPYKPTAFVGEQAHRGPPLRPTAEDIPASVRTAEQQIAALGGIGTEDLLVKRRRLFEGIQQAAAEAPNGGPGPHEPYLTNPEPEKGDCNAASVEGDCS